MLSLNELTLERRRELLALAKRSPIRRSLNTLPSIEKVQRDGPLPLSFAQRRLWFLDQLDPAAAAAYHKFMGVRLRGALDLRALRATLDHIVSRHEILRTRFVLVDGEPQQLISQMAAFALETVELSGCFAQEKTEKVRWHIEEEARRPFDLSEGPLIRGRLLRWAEDEHVLLLRMHHIICDGWSTGVLIQEVSALYGAYHQGRCDPLPPLPIQYADFAVWQRQWLQDEVLQKQLDFWRQHLAGAPPLLTLPTDRSRPAVQSYRGSSVPLTLSKDLTLRLRALALSHHTTLFATLLGGWAVLLARLCGQSDVVIGTSIANRQRPETQGLIGFFVNTLALRITLADNPSVAELMRQVKATLLDAQEHQDLPFEQLVEALSPARSLGNSPIFQCMLSLNNTPSGGELNLPGIGISMLEIEQTTTPFDLTLALTEANEEISGGLEYASDLFDRATVQRMAAYYERLLTDMVVDEERRTDALRLLSDAERWQLLVGRNATAVGYPQARCIHECFEAQVARTPQALALVYEGQALTYQELNCDANRLAHWLLALGLKPEERVVLYMPRSPQLIVGMLGVLKAGGAYVPLDPEYPMARLRFVLEDCAPVALLTQQGVRALPDAPPLPSVRLDAPEDKARIALHPACNLPPAALGLSSQHLAYVIYTSGSTGQPKGVMVEHQGVCNLTQAQSAAFGLTPASRVLQCAAVGFDAAVSEIFTTLCSGAALHLAPAGTRLVGAALQQQLLQRRITQVTLAPLALGTLPEALELPALQTLVVAGEACAGQLIQRWRVGRRLINAYGPTEATVCASMRVCNVLDEHTPSIGRPLQNVQLYVLDAHLEPVPLGVVGELYIGGVGVARGYLNRAELTAERFIADPFSTRSGARLYKSGDLVRYRADGNLEFIGRTDTQLKLRGFRIEPAEIEAALRSAHAAVREALVVATGSPSGERRLVAYLGVSAEPAPPPTPAALRSALAARLPEYMLPSAYVLLAALPLTAHGKIDRQALPAPDATAAPTRAYEAPRGPIEIALAEEIWKPLLGLEKIGRHDHFFELGGHSLLLVKMHGMLNVRFGSCVSITDLFKYTTIERLGHFISSASEANAQTPRTGIARGEKRRSRLSTRRRIPTT